MDLGVEDLLNVNNIFLNNDEDAVNLSISVIERLLYICYYRISCYKPCSKLIHINLQSILISRPLVLILLYLHLLTVDYIFTTVLLPV